MKLGVPLGVVSVTACLFGLWSWLTSPEISIKSHDPKVEFIEAKWHPTGFSEFYNTPGVEWWLYHTTFWCLDHGIINRPFDPPKWLWHHQANPAVFSNSGPALVVFYRARLPQNGHMLGDLEKISPENRAFIRTNSIFKSMELFDANGNRAFDCVTLNDWRILSKALIFDMSTLTNGVYHLRLPGETNNLADLRVKLRR